MNHPHSTRSYTINPPSLPSRLKVWRHQSLPHSMRYQSYPMWWAPARLIRYNPSVCVSVTNTWSWRHRVSVATWLVCFAIIFTLQCNVCYTKHNDSKHILYILTVSYISGSPTTKKQHRRELHPFIRTLQHHHPRDRPGRLLRLPLTPLPRGPPSKARWRHQHDSVTWWEAPEEDVHSVVQVLGRGR